MRPCTIEDFEGIEEEFEFLTGGLEDAVFCPEDSSDLLLENGVQGYDGFKAWLIEFE